MVIDVAMVLGMIAITYIIDDVLFIVRFTGTMSEKITAEKRLNTLVETLGERQKSGSFFEKQKSGSFFEKQNSGSFFEDVTANSMTSQFNKLFGREKPVHHILGGGKCMAMAMAILVNFL
jgi:hypothetical protein